MSRRVVTSGHGGGGISLSERFAGLSQARQSVASHIPRSSDRGGRGGGRGRSSDRGVTKPHGQRQRRDDEEGSRDRTRGRGRGSGRGRGRGRDRSQRDSLGGGKPRDGKGKDKKKKPLTTDDLDKDLINTFLATQKKRRPTWMLSWTTL